MSYETNSSNFLSMLLGKVAFTKQALFMKTLDKPKSSNSF